MYAQKLRKLRYKRKKRSSITAIAGAVVSLIIFGIILSSSNGKPAAGSGGLTYTPAEGLSAADGIHAGEPVGDKKRIVIDPGHGGSSSPGCVYDGVRESDLNLAMAFRVRDYLKELGYDVVLTREDDSPMSLADRAAFAENVKAGVFISIHHNALENDTVTEGIETWYNDETNSANVTLAGYIQNETSNITDAKNRGLKVSKRMVHLQGTSMPACLIEVGFLSSDKERERLINSKYQDKIAQGIVNGIEMFFMSRE